MAQALAVALGQQVDRHRPQVETAAGVLGSGVAEADRQKVGGGTASVSEQS